MTQIVKDANVPTILEHGGTCRSWFLFEKEALRQETMGGYLEFVDEFELLPGARLEPHSHDTDEFYYLLTGEARMRVGDDEFALGTGQLVRIPRNEIHSIWTTGDDGFRALAFAISYMPENRVGYTTYPEDGSPSRFVPSGSDRPEHHTA
ncbi:cupin domain-containing protein [Herbiconiux sp. CPCC 205763]|uniref:Cupin domain-containing protein n=1 Tax=Herbiconiux aconitum TaxID=2970913 RepID=A0ABT2GMY0_9MICO|nr:cupin domain-containing protein [Herbiconiux aconitum]MCS5717583.1 cupin domain-containing protein [Herbiconiux aconitum]